PGGSACYVVPTATTAPGCPPPVLLWDLHPGNDNSRCSSSPLWILLTGAEHPGRSRVGGVDGRGTAVTRHSGRRGRRVTSTRRPHDGDGCPHVDPQLVDTDPQAPGG